MNVLIEESAHLSGFLKPSLIPTTIQSSTASNIASHFE